MCSMWIHMYTLQWRHNERGGASNQRRLDCLLKRLFRRRSKKMAKLASPAFVRGIHWWPMASLHKEPVTRKMFPFDDVIMHVSVSHDLYKHPIVYVIIYWMFRISCCIMHFQENTYNSGPIDCGPEPRPPFQLRKNTLPRLQKESFTILCNAENEKSYWDALPSYFICLYAAIFGNDNQGWFWVCPQPMRDGVTL